MYLKRGSSAGKSHRLSKSPVIVSLVTDVGVYGLEYLLNPLWIPQNDMHMSHQISSASTAEIDKAATVLHRQKSKEKLK